MEKNQGFLSNLNFPVKKTIQSKAQNNIFGMRRKVNDAMPHDISDSPSDIELKKPKAQQITPQRKMSSNQVNKILVTNSSNSKDKETIQDPDTEDKTNKKDSKSLTFPDSFSIPKPAETNVDTEINTDESNFVPKVVRKSPAQYQPPRNSAYEKDTIIETERDTDVSKYAQKAPAKPPQVPRNSAYEKDTIIHESEDYREHLTEDESEEEEEVIPVYDSEEEASFNDMQPPVQKSSFYNCSRTSSSTINNFFNNPPSIDARMAVRHSDILRFKPQNAHVRPPIPLIEENFGEEDVSILSLARARLEVEESALSKEKDRARDDSESEDIEIGPTDESGNVEEDEIVQSPPRPARATPKPSSEVVISSNTPNTIKAQISTPGSKKKNVTHINIKLDLKIEIREGGDTSTSSNSTQSSPRSPTPLQLTESSANPASASNSKNKSTHVNKQVGTPVQILAEPKTPPKEDLLIDEDMQNMLNSLYGESWKTPQLLKSCKSKRVRENLRKSLHANNFESFIRNLPSDLESTRLTAIDSDEQEQEKKSEEEFRKPIAPLSGKKASTKKPKPRSRSNTDSESDQFSTPKSKSKAPRTPITTPRYLEICDPDTPSSSSEASDDEDFNPNDTWNASSDEEYNDEAERIKKRQTIRQSVHVQELTFTKEESVVEQKKIDDLLDKYLYKKPPQIGDSAKKSKRKLFTHSHFIEDEEEEVIKPKSAEPIIEEKENRIPKGFKWPSPVKKVETPTVRKTPAKTPKSTAKEIQKRFGPLSFLKSLDAEANRSLCDPDALFYRNNYKSKKNELAEKLFKLYNEKVFDSKLTEVPMKWNKKLLNTAGRCNNSRRNGVRQSSLELSDKVLTSADRLRCTLIHEMCHAAAWILDGENGHGAVWKRWAARANFIFSELPKISVCHDYIIEYRYTYLCINCKAQSKTHSKSRKVEEIQCSICRGEIKLFENKKNAKGDLEMIPVEKKEVTGFAKFVKLKFKEVKRPNMTHKEVMQILSTQFQSLTVEEKTNL